MPTTAPKKILLVVPGDRAERLSVMLLVDAKATNGQEFQAGEVIGVVPQSAVDVVLGGKGRAYCHDQKAGKEWAKALVDLGGLAMEDDAKILDMICGPFRKHVDEQLKQIDEAQAAARERERVAEEAAAKAKVEAEVAAREAAAKAAAEAETKAKEAADLKARQDAEEKRIADEEAKLAADGLKKAAADVSNADAQADDLREPAPAEAPPAKTPDTKRGNRTPRS